MAMKEKVLTMENPNTGIVSYDTQSSGVHRRDLYSVTTDRVQLTLNERWVQGDIIGRVVFRTGYDHGLMSV